MNIDIDIVNTIIEKVDIVEYISQFCELEQKGREYWGLSPFKDEKTPSFSVDPQKKCFYDFSSGLRGNIINFVRYWHKCSFHEAIEKLLDYAKIDCGGAKATKRLSAVGIAKQYCTSNRGKPPNDNCVILQPDYMTRFEIDYSKLSVWTDEGIRRDIMKKFDVRYDRFSNRIVYPIKNYNGDIVNVGGRTLDPNYKEKGLRKYTYFMPWNGSMDVIYGYSENKQAILSQKEIILFEGAKSVMLANGWGVNNCCAILTSHLSYPQFIFLVRLGVRVVFALDKDVSINDDVNIRKLQRYVNVEYICDNENILENKDSPVDKGMDLFINLYNNRKTYKQGVIQNK